MQIKESLSDKPTLPPNTKLYDSSSKLIFEDNLLCSQFLRDYIDLAPLKDVRPEDIEDVSSQFVPLFEEERNADRVKKVTIKGNTPYFLISLIEHKSQVDYNICMQIFRYMICIWESYEKEMEKLHPGISKQASFQYPPIVPIVYYEGKAAWTAPMDFKSRIVNGDEFAPYIPDFSYYLVPVHNYSNDTLIAGGDEISLVMLINKLQSKQDLQEFQKLPTEKLNAMLTDTPKYLREIIANVFLAFMLKARVPIDEATSLADKVKEKQMGQLFENMEDINLNADLIKEDGIKALILCCYKLNASSEDIISNLMEHFSLSYETAKEKTELYLKD